MILVPEYIVRIRSELLFENAVQGFFGNGFGYGVHDLEVGGMKLGSRAWLALGEQGCRIDGLAFKGGHGRHQVAFARSAGCRRNTIDADLTDLRAGCRAPARCGPAG